LNQIIGDFLDYSRPREYQFAVLDLTVLIQDTLTLLGNRPELSGNGKARVKIVRDLPAGAAWACVDGDRIKQVFWNICDNALNAMPEGGTLRVRLHSRGGEWELRFADTGICLPPQAVDKIFEPFQSGFHKGTGLGLAIVYDIVQAHEGRITVQAAPGGGTEFVLQLKRTAPQTQMCAAAGTEN
jgi:two-component system sensor histidine kinase PilS (NtrC family)